MNEVAQKALPVLTPADLLDSWQGHRRLTRRIIEQFPEDQLFSFNVGGMRPFGSIAWELHSVADYTLGGMVSGEWGEPKWSAAPPQDRASLLAAWDDLTARLDALLPTVPPARYHEVQKTFWATMPGHGITLYAVDNEVHHRGQGYVYLRALGIEPVPFWER